MRSNFDKNLEDINITLTEMGAHVEKAIEDAITALKDKNKQLALSVIENDQTIDDYEKNIESKCFRLLLSQQPVARDLRTVSTALKIITDMERIGDQAADICEVMLHFIDDKYIKKPVHIAQMAERSVKMVNEAINAFVARDVEQAKKVIAMDDEIDALFVEVKEELISLMIEDKNISNQAIDFVMIAKYLERIGDHAENIADWAILAVTGVHKDKRVF